MSSLCCLVSSGSSALLMRISSLSLCSSAQTQKEVRFWFATGGAGFCLSRGLALKMSPWAR